jgi:hypothetical protein
LVFQRLNPRFQLTNGGTQPVDQSDDSVFALAINSAHIVVGRQGQGCHEFDDSNFRVDEQ